MTVITNAEFTRRLLAETTDLDVLDRVSEIHRRGFECDDCGHRHSGAAVGFICIGCPCPRITPKGLAL